MIYHTPVLLKECLDVLRENLDIKSADKKLIIDCNLGEGGHSEAFLKTFENATIVALDCDSKIIEVAKNRLKDFEGRVQFFHYWSDDFLSSSLCPQDADCIFFDFGISMYHYKASKRGFSFLDDERLDMRLNEDQEKSAYTIVNYTKEKDLADLIYKYSDERKSYKIAKAICLAREDKKIETTLELKQIVDSCFSDFEKRKSSIQVATRTFQAIRIAVNSELDRIEKAILAAIGKIKKNGIVAAISFHSSEDRIIKWAFRDAQKSEKYKILTPHPIVADDNEVDNNNASRSAKLRVLRREV